VSDGASPFPSGPATSGPATSGWAESATGIAISDVASPIGVGVRELVRLGLRDNPRRLHLLVSRVLGKHIPTDPRIVLGAGRLLGALVDDDLTGAGGDDLPALGAALSRALSSAGEPAAATSASDGSASDGSAAGFEDAVTRALAARAGRARPSIAVLGFAETATALGHAVSDGLPGSRYLHSTRRIVAGAQPLAGFAEEHSHAPDHRLLPDDAAFLAAYGPDEPLVLVDDELSTGRTAANTIAALQAVWPRRRYVVAALVDVRPAPAQSAGVPADDALAEVALRLGVRVDVVALARGAVEVPADARERLGAALRSAAMPSRAAPAPTGEPRRIAPRHAAKAPAADPARIVVPARAIRESGRHGILPGDRAALAELARETAERLATAAPTGPVLVLGGEELMYAPLRIAAELAALRPDDAEHAVRFSTTTRSPALPLDVEGYPLRSTLRFRALDQADVIASDAEDPLARYGYNAHGPTGTIVLMIDDPCDTPELSAPGGLLDQLADRAERVVVVVLPAYRPGAALPEPLRGPRFGSYAPEEVGWLLSDLSDVALEAPTEEREEAVQSGGAHYAESLPIEYLPSAGYTEAFETALAAGARDVAIAVGVVAGLIRDRRGDDPVLVSLARAGTPIGILLQRWWAREYGASPAHYAISIVRGRGIDGTALRWLDSTHGAQRIAFVDGWTGKGAIVRELAAALADPALPGGFDPSIAVLADPGGCVELHGTREDLLIPSAALNSTVSGLVSRTVLNPRLLSASAFHGAKFYRQLSDADVSARFLDAVSAQFEDVAAEVELRLAVARQADRSPTWAGWAAVERVSAAYGIDDVTLVKPGIGETTRVLLRRVPWRVLVRSADLERGALDGAAGSAGGPLRHILLLAQERGVPIEGVDDLPYACMGLIHPRYTRGATGSGGTAAVTAGAE
jgi:hypothetical protein